nr:hypothetical protein [Tanacetum cinerariifolium]
LGRVARLAALVEVVRPAALRGWPSPGAGLHRPSPGRPRAAAPGPCPCPRVAPSAACRRSRAATPALLRAGQSGHCRPLPGCGRPLLRLRAAQARQLGNVGPGYKCLFAAAREQNAAHGRILLRLDNGLAQLGDSGRVERVELGGPVDSDGKNAGSSIQVVEQVLEGSCHRKAGWVRRKRGQRYAYLLITSHLFSMSIIAEFKEFISKGNVLDLAVGVIIGAAFGKIVSSLTDDILMPLVGLATSKGDLGDYQKMMLGP